MEAFSDTVFLSSHYPINRLF